MTRRVIAAIVVLLVAAGVLIAQQSTRPMSPAGSTQAQVLGKWTRGERPAFTLGRENYVGGKWIEITYGRPLQRGRDLFGSGENYGKAALDVGSPTLPAPPVWRAGANVSTQLNTEVPLIFGDAERGAVAPAERGRGAGAPAERVRGAGAPAVNKVVPPGEYSLFIDLKPTVWTLIVSSWPAQTKFDPNDKTALWGAYGYTPDKDVARIPMKVETLPFAVEQLTWSFLDMTNEGGRLAIMWGKTMASAPFKAGTPR